MLHQLICVVEFVERIRRETERFREQTDEVIAELLHPSEVSFKCISESWYKLFIGPLGTGPIVNSDSRSDAGDRAPG